MTSQKSRRPQSLTGVHRVGSGLLGVGLLIFGVLGFSDQLNFFSTTGTPILGLATNVLLSGGSVVLGLVLMAAAIRGGRLGWIASVAIGALFVLSGVVHLLILNTSLNVLSFRVSNVVFSLVVGGILLALGIYGRFNTGTPVDSPDRDGGDGRPKQPEDNRQMLPEGADEITATVEMAEAERAVAAGTGTSAQRRGVASMDGHRDTESRRAAWRGVPGPEDAPE
ncbi:uncharacterized protein DUF4383 [Pseudonocardia sediminis]|uniref:Uncharacterized protein DUF4383 n=1 Tax=Pseudonocardia sediminis TaxID=1397368 RepID=A0A4Q7UPJ5_PSEST|nr:DUF4383 domain-containing protein [Pseudonocardia sediminis]RZT83677.1 uncharacterized protein DUF4383 [Pseudonocardia sediminis]